MSIDEIAPEALRLPVRERALLAESLWESLDEPYLANAGMTDAEAAELAAARDAEIEHGQVEALSHEELMRRLRG